MTTNGLKCVFPFVWKSISYVICTDVDYHGIAWCATETGPGDTYISGKWGNCSRYYIITYILRHTRILFFFDHLIFGEEGVCYYKKD